MALPQVPSTHFDTLSALARAAGIPKTLRQGDILHLQGDAPTGFYLVESGELQSYVISEEGKQVVIEVFSPGMLFGGASYFNRLPRPTSIMASTPARLYLLRLEDILPHLLRSPALIEALCGLLCNSIFPLSVKIASLAFHTADRRVACILLGLGQHFGQTADGGFSIPYTHQNIADLAGINRVTATRVLRFFERKHWLALHYKQIDVCAPRALQAFLASPAR